jgi:hypothetical protein
MHNFRMPFYNCLHSIIVRQSYTFYNDFIPVVFFFGTLKFCIFILIYINLRTCRFVLPVEWRTVRYIYDYDECSYLFVSI